MAASYNTIAIIKGSKDELRASLDILNKYIESDDIHFEFPEIGKPVRCKDGITMEKSSFSLEQLSSDKETNEFLESIGDSLMISVSGPYGHFALLDEVRFFEDIADAVPFASIEGNINGFDNGGSQAMSCKTEDGKLHLYYKSHMDDYDNDFEDEDSDEPDSEYIYDPFTKEYETLYLPYSDIGGYEEFEDDDE